MTEHVDGDTLVRLPAKALGSLLKEQPELVGWREPHFHRTLLHVAAAASRSSAIEVLREHGAEVNAQDHIGWTPLHVAVSYGSVGSTRKLLKAGADVTARDRWGVTPYALGIQHGTEESRKPAEIVRQHGGDPDLLCAVAQLDRKSIAEYLTKEREHKWPYHRHLFAELTFHLGYAVLELDWSEPLTRQNWFASWDDVARELIAFGAYVNAFRLYSGGPAIFIAASSGDCGPQGVEFVLRHGGDPTATYGRLSVLDSAATQEIRQALEKAVADRSSGESL